MNVSFMVWKRNLQKKITRRWIVFTKPLSEWVYQREDKKYNELKESITEKQAVQWIAEDLVKNIVRRERKMYYLVADGCNSDDFQSYFFLQSDYNNVLKRKKTKIAYRKLNADVVIQEKVISVMRNMKGINIEELKEELNFRRAKNYKKTYIVSLEK